MSFVHIFHPSETVIQKNTNSVSESARGLQKTSESQTVRHFAFSISGRTLLSPPEQF